MVGTRGCERMMRMMRAVPPSIQMQPRVQAGQLLPLEVTKVALKGERLKKVTCCRNSTR